MQNHVSDTKRCIKCQTVLPNMSEYFPIMVKRITTGNRPKLRAHCRNCDKRLSKQRRTLKRKYGNPPLDHICPVCLRNEAMLRKQTEQKSLWALDHDHSTGAFRGWVCHPCNRAIGALHDDVDVLQRAIKHIAGGSVGQIHQSNHSR